MGMFTCFCSFEVAPTTLGQLYQEHSYQAEFRFFLYLNSRWWNNCTFGAFRRFLLRAVHHWFDPRNYMCPMPHRVPWNRSLVRMATVLRYYLLRPVSFHFPPELNTVKSGLHTIFDFHGLIATAPELCSLVEEAIFYPHFLESSA